MDKTLSSKREYAGLIGRFQPWHRGHQAMLEEIVAQGYQPILFMGSCNATRDFENNPFSFAERVRIIDTASKKLRYQDGSPVVPICVPIYDTPRNPEEKPYMEAGKKLVPLNTSWFAQFVDFFESSGISPDNFTLFYSAKDKDKKNYVFQRLNKIGDTQFSFSALVHDKSIFESEDLSLAFKLFGTKRYQLPVTSENATDIRLDFLQYKHFLVPGTLEVIEQIISEEQAKNLVFDGQNVAETNLIDNALSILQHPRRIRDAYIHKSPQDPTFHKRVLLIGGEGSLGLPVIESLLENGHDLILNHYASNPEKFRQNVEKIAQKFPDAYITFNECDLRHPRTWEKSYWEETFLKHNVNAVFNMAGIIEEKPQIGLSFENINYKPVKAIAEACVSSGIDRLIYVSTITAGYKEAEENARSGNSLTYAGSKRKAEITLEELSDKLNWVSVRPITVFNPSTPDWGRPMTFPHLANLAFMPVLGSGRQPLQPLYIGDLAKAARLIESSLKGGHILEAVGPEQITLQKAMTLLRKPSSEFASVNVTYDVAEFLAETYPYGGINPSFVKVMKSRESGEKIIASQHWARAIGEEGHLTSLEDIYGGQNQDIQFAEPPIVEYAGVIAKNPEPLFQFLARKVGQSPLLERFRQAFSHFTQDTKSTGARENLKQAVFDLLRSINLYDDDNDHTPKPI